MNALDSDGNTPLMCAVLFKRFKILETWLKDKELVKKVDLNLVNDEGKTLLMLLLEHSHLKMFRMFLHTAEEGAKKSINKVDNDNNTALLLASQMGKWAFAKEILINKGLKIQGILKITNLFFNQITISIKLQVIMKIQKAQLMFIP